MPLQFIRGDITKLSCDAIVNAANTTLLGGGGVDGAIHRAAGPGLLDECRKLGGCKTGKAKITKGYKLPCKYVIHTPGPIWRGGDSNEPQLLASCYLESLKLAKENNCTSVAFPLISSGAYGYPKAQALNIATGTITSFLAEEADDMLVYLVLFDKSSFVIGEKLYSDIKSFIDDNYVDEMYKDKELFGDRSLNLPPLSEAMSVGSGPLAKAKGLLSPKSQKHKKRDKAASLRSECEGALVCEDAEEQELSALLQCVDESFSEMLLRKIDEKKMKDSECYKKANIDRKLFSKIRSDKLYKPSKNTALAFAIALELPLDETKEMLSKAGFSLTHSSKSDIIIEYFINKGIYDIFSINEALFSFDQKLLGA